MEIIVLLFMVTLPIAFLVWALKFKGLLSMLGFVPLLMLMVIVFSLNAEASEDNHPALTYKTSLLNSTTTTDNNVNDDIFYNVQSSNADLTINSVTRSIMAEYPSTTSSQLDGEVFNCMSVYISKIGSPPVGTPVIMGVFDGSGNTIKTFRSLNVTEIGTSYNWYDGCLPGSETWTISATDGNRIGVMYADGDGSNSVTSRRDTNDPYDGTITFLQQFTGSWSTFSSTNDMTMQLYLSGGGEQSTTYTYTEQEIPLVIGFANMQILNFSMSMFVICVGFVIFRRMTRERNVETE